jgi:2'-hydroxyisoflavone reductase
MPPLPQSSRLANLPSSPGSLEQPGHALGDRMPLTRRSALKLAALGALTPALPALATATAAKAPNPRPLRILILGGTGFTGPFQVEYALARGHQVTVFNRGKRAAPDWSGKVEQLRGDRDSGDLAALEGREWDVCIDNPTSIPAWVRDAGRVLAGKVGHYIFISTISVYARLDRPGMDEDAELASYAGADPLSETTASLMADVANLYGPLKAASEAEAQRQFAGITSIIRPGFIVGPRDQSDRFSYWPLRIADGGEVLVPGDGSDPVQFIDGRDLAQWTVRLAEDRRFGVFNATGPDFRLSTAAMVHGMHAAIGGPAEFRFVPTSFLRRHQVGFGSDLPIWLPAEGETAGFASVSIARARAAGLSFRPLASTVVDLLAWYRSLPAERQAKPGAGMSRQREAELLAAWRAEPRASG